jgi:hypothetical protein
MTTSLWRGTKVDFATLRTKIINIWNDRKERIGSNALIVRKTDGKTNGILLKDMVTRARSATNVERLVTLKGIVK